MAVSRVLRSGEWFRYPWVEEHNREAETFEREWESGMGSKHACLVTSGTAALMCSYAALELGPGDEIIIPGYTFMASALAPLAMGAIPVLADIDGSLQLDPASVRAAITPRTRAISVVHMNGFMADMDQLLQIAKEHDLRIVEDACQCIGGRWSAGRRAGTIGDLGAFSFNSYKLISCGEGGMFVSNDDAYFERGLQYHDGGIHFLSADAERLGVEQFAGVNFRGSEILAAIMRVQHGRLDEIIDDLLANRSRVIRQLDLPKSVSHIPYNGGLTTGTGAHLGLRFESETYARQFQRAMTDEKLFGIRIPWMPIDSGRHVFTNWTPVLERRGSYARKSDPYRHPLNDRAPVYSTDSFPRTLEYLSTTVLIPIDPDWTDTEAGEVSEAMSVALATLPLG